MISKPDANLSEEEIGKHNLLPMSKRIARNSSPDNQRGSTIFSKGEGTDFPTIFGNFLDFF